MAMVTIERAAQIAGWSRRAIELRIKSGSIKLQGYRIKTRPSGHAYAVRVVDDADVRRAMAESLDTRRRNGRNTLTAEQRQKGHAATRHYYAIYRTMPEDLKRKAGKSWLSAAKRYASGLNV